MSEIIFYDIASSKPGQAWSPNTWKARYVLNYKGLPYRTEWVEYPDIEAVAIKVGATPTGKRPDGSPLYTCPFIYDPKTKRTISDSWAIAEYLDATYPDTKPVVPAQTRPLQKAFCDMTGDTGVTPLRYFVIPATYKVLSPRSQEYFRFHREKAFGKTLETIAPTGDEGVKAWEGISKVWSQWDAWLQLGKDADAGPWFFGKDITFVDFVVSARLLWIREVMGEESPEWNQIKTWDNGRWLQFVDSLKQYETVA